MIEAMAIGKASIFQQFFYPKRFVDRLGETAEAGVDVIIPLLNTNELWESNLLSFYREIPIHRLLIGDAGCSDEAIEIAKRFPRVTVLSQAQYQSQGYCLKELIEKVETDWFLYLHADVYLPKGWYDEMVRHQGHYEWFECGRHFAHLIYDTNDIQFHNQRAYSGSQMGRRSAFDGILHQIEDDYIRRTEDIFFQQKLEGQGLRYGKVATTYHIHQVTANPRDRDTNWKAKTSDETFRATVKYLVPGVGHNTYMAGANMEYIIAHHHASYTELMHWVRQTNPSWANPLRTYHLKWSIISKAINAIKFVMRKSGIHELTAS